MDWVIWLILGIYIAVMAFIGIMSARKVKNLTSFIVGKREAGPWKSAFAYGTTYFSAVLFIGYAGKSGWDYGLWAVLIGLGNAIFGAWLAWKLLAERTRSVTRRMKIKTMPQLFEKRYNSKAMKVYAAVIIFIFMTPYSASVYSGLSYLCENVLGINYQTAMAVIAIVAAVYLVLGGYLASLTADFVQGIVMGGGIVAMIFFIMNSQQVGGITEGIPNLLEKMDEAGMDATTPSFWIGLIGLIMLTSFGTWGMPQMVHKFYGIADKKSIKTGTIVSTAFCLVISVGAYFVGSLSRLFFEEVPSGNHDLIVPQILVQSLPTVLLGIVLVLVLSASVSTLSGITLTSCSSITMDIISSVIFPKMSREKALVLTRVLCLIFIFFSYLIAVQQSPILLLMSFSWGCISGSFLAPYILGLYWKRMNKTGAWCGMIGGLIVAIVLTIISKAVNLDSGMSAACGIAAMIASLIFCVIGTLLSKKPANSEAFFEAEANDGKAA